MNKTNGLVINPLTQRPIKIGGRVYKQLLNDGYFEGTTNVDTPKYKLKEQHKPIKYKPSKQIDSYETENENDSDSDISLININDDVDEGDEGNYDIDYEEY